MVELNPPGCALSAPASEVAGVAEDKVCVCVCAWGVGGLNLIFHLRESYVPNWNARSSTFSGVEHFSWIRIRNWAIENFSLRGTFFYITWRSRYSVHLCTHLHDHPRRRYLDPYQVGRDFSPNDFRGGRRLMSIFTEAPEFVGVRL